LWEEWRELLRTSAIKYEYIDGWVYAMAGETLDHARIAINVIRALEDGLGHRPCWVYNSDAAARLSARRYTFPDVSVTCDPGDQGQVTEVRAPRVIVEVLSDGTEAYDRGDKFRYYQACSTIEEYVLIATKRQAIEVYRRARRGWTYELYGPDDTVQLAAIGVQLPCALVYRRTQVPRDVEEPEGEV
jgi:Uma2 family endonuclease